MRLRSWWPFLVVLSLAPLGATAQNNDPCKNLKAQISPATYTVSEGGFLEMNGRASQGTSFAWTQTAGPAVVLQNANTDRASFVAPDVGPGGATLTFRLTVRATGCSVPEYDDATVTVNDLQPVNRAPAALAIATPAFVDEGEPFALDGSGSTDPDGDALEYVWEELLDDGSWDLVSSLATVQLTAPPAPYPNGRTLTFRLTVSDGALTDAATILVNVLWVNDPPVASAVCPAEIDEGEDVLLDGEGSTDADDGIASYAWEQLSGPDALIPPVSLALPSITFPAPSLVKGRGDTMAFRLTVTDSSGTSDAAECAVRILDVTPPDVTVPASFQVEAAGLSGAVVTYAASAYDAWDGALTPVCVPASGTTFAPGTTTVTCTASDAAGNVGTASFDVAVKFVVSGFHQPVDAGVLNTVKGGSTVPLKWELFGAGGVELTDVGAVASTQARTIACSTSALEDAIEVTATGGTVLRYDLTGGQFVFNWQTPRAPGTCVQVDVGFIDESSLTAKFKLK